MLFPPRLRTHAFGGWHADSWTHLIPGTLPNWSKKRGNSGSSLEALPDPDAFDPTPPFAGVNVGSPLPPFEFGLLVVPTAAVASVVRTRESVCAHRSALAVKLSSVVLDPAYLKTLFKSMDDELINVVNPRSAEMLHGGAQLPYLMHLLIDEVSARLAREID